VPQTHFLVQMYCLSSVYDLTDVDGEVSDIVGQSTQTLDLKRTDPTLEPQVFAALRMVIDKLESGRSDR
jgi:hypothetical protein